VEVEAEYTVSRTLYSYWWNNIGKIDTIIRGARNHIFGVLLDLDNHSLCHLWSAVRLNRLLIGVLVLYLNLLLMGVPILYLNAYILT